MPLPVVPVSNGSQQNYSYKWLKGEVGHYENTVSVEWAYLSVRLVEACHFCSY